MTYEYKITVAGRDVGGPTWRGDLMRSAALRFAARMPGVNNGALLRVENVTACEQVRFFRVWKYDRRDPPTGGFRPSPQLAEVDAQRVLI